MLTKSEITEYINERLTDLGFFEYKKEPDTYKNLGIFNNMYNISVREINPSSNIRCELHKKEIIGGVAFAGKLCTSCVVSDWHKDKYKEIDNWIDNILLIPDIILRIRNNKIKKIQKIYHERTRYLQICRKSN